MQSHSGAGDRWIPEDEYRFICSKVPIVCVDLLPLAGAGHDFGLIERETYGGGRGLNLIGGAVLLDEPLTEALERHLTTTLGAAVRLDVETLRFIGTYQYFKTVRPGELHDPRKNAISLSYSGVYQGDSIPQGEALAFHRYALSTPPPLREFGFGQGRVVYDGLRQLGAID